MEVKVNLDITNATFPPARGGTEGGAENSKNILLKANSSSLVEFEVEVNPPIPGPFPPGEKGNDKNSSSTNFPLALRGEGLRVGDESVKNTSITLTAKNKDNSLSDSIVLEKPIYPNDSGEYVFTN
jgi:hypothetical protein